MTTPLFLTRVVLLRYRSIASCDVRLHRLTHLVGPNGAGKSNFLDALHLVRDALGDSLALALQQRGGLSEVCRRDPDGRAEFGIRLEVVLPGGECARYAFSVERGPNRDAVVSREECVIGQRAAFVVERGRMVACSESTFPAGTADRLALVALSGVAVFRPLYDALTAIGCYHLNPKVMRELHAPQDGRMLSSSGDNIAAVLGRLERNAPDAFERIQEYLRTAIPGVMAVQRCLVGPMETLQFHQQSSGDPRAGCFLAGNMSDGTLRAVGVLTALFQRHAPGRPSMVGIEEPETALHPSASAPLREALDLAANDTQVLVTSHSPDLLDDPGISPESILAVATVDGDTRIGPIDDASRQAILARLFSAGELLRMNQLVPDHQALAGAPPSRHDLFGDAA